MDRERGIGGLEQTLDHGEWRAISAAATFPQVVFQ
jgi:hypothetical protein